MGKKRGGCMKLQELGCSATVIGNDDIFQAINSLAWRKDMHLISRP